VLLDSIALLEKQKRSEFEDRRMSTALGNSACSGVAAQVSRAVKLPDLDVARAKADVDASLLSATATAAELKGPRLHLITFPVLTARFIAALPLSRAEVPTQFSFDGILAAIKTAGSVGGPGSRSALQPLSHLNFVRRPFVRI
jgi:hypothetical protein